MSTTKEWFGHIPEECETCSNKIVSEFYDAMTVDGPWACMCEECFKNGPGLGILGLMLGQKYEKQEDDSWIKTAG